tara:strand:- start:4730 stop:5023 length:294 start_codon:yes stop_codon:yes gene_type:complete
MDKDKPELNNNEENSKKSRHNKKFDEMLEQFRNHSVNPDTIDDNVKKTIIIGIQESLQNEKLIDAGRALYVNFKLVRLFSPIIYKIYINSGKTKNTV